MKSKTMLMVAIASVMSTSIAAKSVRTIGHTSIRPSGSKITASRNKAKKQRRKAK